MYVHSAICYPCLLYIHVLIHLYYLKIQLATHKAMSSNENKVSLQLSGINC